MREKEGGANLIKIHVNVTMNPPPQLIYAHKVLSLERFKLLIVMVTFIIFILKCFIVILIIEITKL
jgi:hypothetical protein